MAQARLVVSYRISSFLRCSNVFPGSAGAGGSIGGGISGGAGGEVGGEQPLFRSELLRFLLTKSFR